MDSGKDDKSPLEKKILGKMISEKRPRKKSPQTKRRLEKKSS